MVGKIRAEDGRLPKSPKVHPEMPRSRPDSSQYKAQDPSEDSKGIYIVRKAERMLMNERVRLINNMITMFRWQIDTCINSLGSCIGVEGMEECHGFISLRRERRHLSTLERQTKKFNLLWQRNMGGHSNFQHGGKGYQEENTDKDKEDLIRNNPNNKAKDRSPPKNKEECMDRKWVHNLSKTPLTEDQEKVLVRGPNFVVVTKPPVGEYISQIERVCQQLNQGKVEDLREKQWQSSGISDHKAQYKQGRRKGHPRIEKRPRKDNTDC